VNADSFVYELAKLAGKAAHAKAAKGKRNTAEPAPYGWHGLSGVIPAIRT
jgi:hypothetical protein